jgi:hypothetical protein
VSEPVQDNKEIWKGDLLGRKAEGEYLRKYIERLYGVGKKDQTSFVLNVNSEWGHGKTWFLTELAKELGQNHPVVYFDAWRNDFSKDALLSFVSVVCQSLGEQYSRDEQVSPKVAALKTAFTAWAKKAVPIVAGVAVKKLTGFTVDEIRADNDEIDWDSKDAEDIAQQLTKIASVCAIEEFTKKKEAIKLFELAIKQLVVSLDEYLPICIMVDELDRCRPTYAIELLEAIKHLFATRGIFFILATDTKQLSHSIKAVYGEGFNAEAYLKRFFYAEYVLADPDYERLSKYLFDQAPGIEKYFFLPKSLNENYGLSGIFAKIAEYFRLTVRDQEQVFKVLELIVLSSEKESFDFIFLVVLIALKHKFPVDYFELSSFDDNGVRAFLQKVEQNKKASRVIVDVTQNLENLSRTTSVLLLDMICYYFSLMDGSLDNSRLVRGYTGFVWQQELTIKLTNNVPRDYRTGTYSGKHDLPSYFELLDQMGRGKINITQNVGG